MAATAVVPVMTLGECVFLPQQLLPLRIFEPRYRRMLKEALEGERLFAVSQLDAPCPFTCVGRIVGHVAHPDGTSHVMLEGVRRAKVLRKQRRTPYPRLEVAAVIEDDVPDTPAVTREVARLLAASERLLSPLGADGVTLMERFRGLTNRPGSLADAIAGHLVGDTRIRRSVLECLSPEARLRKVADELVKIEAMNEIGRQGGDENTRGLN
jgi:Lon protease-like protein